MKLFSSNIKNFEETETPQKNYLYFRKRKLLIFQEMELFSLPRKVSYTSGNGNPKKPHIFTKKAFLIFWEAETPKDLLIFSQKKLFLYFGKRKPRKNSLYFRKLKPRINFLYFRK